MRITKKQKQKLTDWASKQKKCSESELLSELRSGDPKHFELKEVEYPFGKRKVYFKKSQEEYELLQGSRCLVVPQKNEKFEELVESSKEHMEKIDHVDLVRIRELDAIRHELKNILPTWKTISEIGFRTPRLLKYYLENGCEYAKGYDVLEANIIAARSLGYEADVYDLNSCKKDLDLSDIDLTVCYHVLEHISDPHKAIKKIYSGMKDSGLLHVEVPLEPGIPNIRYCHLFPFHPRDLEWMLKDAGFEMLAVSQQTHKGGPIVERWLVRKPIFSIKTDRSKHV